MERRTSLVYKILGAVFLLLGVVTLFNLLAAFNATHVLLWRALAYGAADLLLSYGCFRREGWVLPAFALNFIALLALLILGWFVRGTFSLTALAVAAAAGIITLFVYERRRYLDSTLHSWLLGAGFFLLWGAALVYTVSTSL